MVSFVSEALDQIALKVDKVGVVGIGLLWYRMQFGVLFLCLLEWLHRQINSSAYIGHSGSTICFSDPVAVHLALALDANETTRRQRHSLPLSPQKVSGFFRAADAICPRDRLHARSDVHGVTEQAILHVIK